MSFIKRHISLLIPLFITSGCSNENFNDRKNANEVIYKLIEADNHSDIQSVLNAYTDSIEFYPAGKDFTKGIQNVRASYEKLFKENKLSITTEITDTRVAGETAIITGVNRGTKQTIADSSISKIDDKYIAVLVRNGKGEWKIDKLIWGINH